MRSLGWALIQYGWCPYKKRKLGHKYIEGKPCEEKGEDGHLDAKERKQISIV